MHSSGGHGWQRPLDTIAAAPEEAAARVAAHAAADAAAGASVRDCFPDSRTCRLRRHPMESVLHEKLQSLTIWCWNV